MPTALKTEEEQNSIAGEGFCNRATTWFSFNLSPGDLRSSWLCYNSSPGSFQTYPWTVQPRYAIATQVLSYSD